MALAVQPGTTRIGWIGTGIMGTSMAGHLLAAGYEVAAFNRTPAKLRPLLDRGARAADSPRAVAEGADLVFTMVGYPGDVRAVILGADGVLPALRPGGVVVDMTTSEPSLAVEIARVAEARGASALDAPVSGGDLGAREARLSIMVGGDPATFDAVRPLFEIMGRTVVRQGGPGSGQHAKMVNQTLIAGGMVAVCEALLYGTRAGLDPETVLRSVTTGAAGSWGLSNLAPRMIAGDFEPGFFVEHFLKDMGIALAEARRMRLALPGLALAEQLYQALAAQGHARSGTQALILALARLSAVEWASSSARHPVA